MKSCILHHLPNKLNMNQTQTIQIGKIALAINLGQGPSKQGTYLTRQNVPYKYFVVEKIFFLMLNYLKLIK